jgi:hypothetical protein
MSAGRGTLERASFFVDRAEALGVTDRAAFQHFLEAAIVFARSVTFHLQKEYAHQPGFETWYALWQQRLKADSLAAFFLEQRNYVLKQGPLEIGKHVDMHLYSTVTMTTSVSVKVIRAQPWYRRSPTILWQDAVYPIRNWLHQRRRHQGWTRQSRSLGAERAPSVIVKETLRFAEATWNDRPALELLREYLATLSQVVADAEAKFGPGTS